eukprot:10232361-Alexandrium_andersonii.AAC.1
MDRSQQAAQSPGGGKACQWRSRLPQVQGPAPRLEIPTEGSHNEVATAWAWRGGGNRRGSKVKGGDDG